MSNTELIPVTKHGEYLEVHPVAYAQHEALGWVKCARQEPADDVPDGAKKAPTAPEIKATLEAAGVTVPDGAKKAPTAPEIKATLEAAGVTVPDGAKKADLVALLNAFERSGLTGADWNNLADEDRAARIAQ
jgi:hypothetical protein